MNAKARLPRGKVEGLSDLSGVHCFWGKLYKPCAANTDIFPESLPKMRRNCAVFCRKFSLPSALERNRHAKSGGLFWIEKGISQTRKASRVCLLPPPGGSGRGTKQNTPGIRLRILGTPNRGIFIIGERSRWFYRGQWWGWVERLEVWNREEQQMRRTMFGSTKRVD